MKTHLAYNQRTGKPEEVVPADVAQGLYDALEAMLEDGVWAGSDWIPSDGAKQRADAALAAADGEAQ